MIYDPIGNRVVSTNRNDVTAYAANELNQYTNILSTAEFIPEFDEDGNQTRVKTSTGIWHITYNAENRPVVWTSTTGIVVEMAYDHMGRRIHKKVSDNNGVQSDLQFIYDGYLQVVSMATNAVTTTFWDPTESIATRPLAMQNGGTVYTYTHDLTKNVMEVLDDSGAPVVTYDYDAFGSMTASTPFANCFGFSSEYFDSDLGCVYYNYRHYNPLDGRWLNRDPMEEGGSIGLFSFVLNQSINVIDKLGMVPKWYREHKCKGCPDISCEGRYHKSLSIYVAGRRTFVIVPVGPTLGGLPGEGSSSEIPLPSVAAWLLWPPDNPDEVLAALRKGAKISCRTKIYCMSHCKCTCEDTTCYTWNTPLRDGENYRGWLSINPITQKPMCSVFSSSLRGKASKCRNSANP